MHNELTKIDIEKMQAEIDYRETRLRPQLIEDVQTARAFGDLSENFEYKAAKQAKNKNESRIRYLKRMIASAVIITTESKSDEVGLFDRVTVYIEEDDEEETIRFVTTVRQNPMEGLISKESPMAQALLGKKVGDRVFIPVGEGGYYVVIRAIEKGEDDAELDITRY